MGKSRWAVARGLGSLALLLAGCGGSPGSSTAASGSSVQGTASSSSASGPSSSASSSSSATSAATARAKSAGSPASQAADAQPSANAGAAFPPAGTTVLIVQHSDLGWVMAKADGDVVYTYSKDSKGTPPSCTGSCASTWTPVTGMPKAGPADRFPGSFAVLTGPGGTKVITYNGYPLYTYASAGALTTEGNGLNGDWHVITLSASDISSLAGLPV
jgi:predicted lipoprotein with Yx(FWY)xxD motif